MMKESAAPAVNQQLIAMLRQQPAFIENVFKAISVNPNILSLIVRADRSLRPLLDKAKMLSKNKQVPMAQPAPTGQPAGMAQPMGQPAGVMAPRASSKIQVNKYASGYYNTPSLPGQMFKSKNELIKKAQQAFAPNFVATTQDTMGTNVNQVIQTIKNEMATAIGNAKISNPNQVFDIIDGLIAKYMPHNQGAGPAAAQKQQKDWETARQTLHPLGENLYRQKAQPQQGQQPTRPQATGAPMAQPRF
jgi:hypothetical protein